MVRVMAANNTPTLRRSIYLLAIYNCAIYLPLVVICICGRTMFPDLPTRNSDEIIPRLAIATTSEFFGGSFVAGLILAAPFGAVMATVSAYLVVIASGLVRDIYQRFINPQASVRKLRLISYVVMIAVGLIAVAANIKPPVYLQAIVVFSGTCGATAFVTPAIMTAFWRRATSAGMIAAMLVGSGTTLLLYIVGWLNGSFGASYRPYLLGGIEPLVWGLLTSCLAGILVSKLTQPPDAARIALCFDKEKG
jgi:SSS family solute:Na+ symporter/sodium/pantothenate symporter